MKTLLAAVCAALAVSACAPSTPQARIDRNPEKFAALGEKQQALVREGKIARGMPEDAVFLAWGPPAERFEGSHHSRPTLRWDYTGSRPVYTNHFAGGLGFGYGGYGGYGYGRYGYSGLGFALGPEVAYIPFRVATVWFEDHRVESWERAR